jgi:D-alanyl-D-alanine carboxypeptidase (penicillin-binding protein 5/6)
MNKLRIIALLLVLLLMNSMFGLSVAADGEKKELVRSETLFELDTGTVLYSKNAAKQVPVGVLCKLLTVLAAAEAVEKSELSLEDTVIAPSFVGVKGASVWLEPGDEISVDELFRSVIIGNANDAAVTLATAVERDPERFLLRTARIAQNLGLETTSITNVHGYTDPEKQLSSASDLAKILTALSKYDFLDSYFATNLDYVRDGSAQLVNSNRLVRFYDGTIGYKYGYTPETGYCVAAAAERGGNRYGAVVLGMSNEDKLFERAKALLNNGFNAYTSIMPELPKDLPEAIPVRGSLESTLSVTPAVLRKLIVHKSDTDSLTAVICLPDYVYAPVKKGSVIGEIHYYINGNVVYKVDICAATDSEKLDFGDNLALLLKNIFTFG